MEEESQPREGEHVSASTNVETVLKGSQLYLSDYSFDSVFVF